MLAAAAAAQTEAEVLGERCRHLGGQRGPGVGRLDFGPLFSCWALNGGVQTFRSTCIHCSGVPKWHWHGCTHWTLEPEFLPGPCMAGRGDIATRTRRPAGVKRCDASERRI